MVQVCEQVQRGLLSCTDSHKDAVVLVRLYRSVGVIN